MTLDSSIDPLVADGIGAVVPGSREGEDRHRRMSSDHPYLLA
jgi:hypothetical protein